jgi:hypothetical protein
MSPLIPAPCALRGPDGLAVIGNTLHSLRGIRFADGDGGAAAGTATGAAAGAGTADATAAGTTAGVEQKAEDGAPWTKENFDPERAWKRIEKMQADAAEKATKTDAAIAAAATAAAEKAKKDTLAEFGRLLAGEEAPETDPEKLQAKVTGLAGQIAEKDTALTAAQALVKAGELSLQVALLAPTLGANTKLLLANEQFKTSIASAEPTDEAALTTAITKALQDNAALKQPPTRTGDGNHTGPTVQSLQAELAAAEKAGNFAEVIKLQRRIAATKAS